ncbi:MAG: rhamnogalacturonan lyase [Verrucomicrobiia bacterium]
MKNSFKKSAEARAILFLVCSFFLLTYQPLGFSQREMEALGRGLVAINKGNGEVFLSWRFLGTDPDSIAFNIYRATENHQPIKLNPQPISESTCYVDTTADLSKSNIYFVTPVLNGRELDKSAPFCLKPEREPKQYISIRLRTPEGYSPNDGSAGDLDGDGEYEIVLHQVGRGRDNSQNGFTTEPILEAYKLDGTFLWRINLGKNIREGAHYTQFIVYDLDGDGRAEIACKTADGAIDGKGNVIGDKNADWRDQNGRILNGPEYLTVFDGLTGAAIFTTNYIPPRGNVADWGDRTGNRVDRFLAAVAYLDGKHPSLIMCRGYYTRTVVAAWDFTDKKLNLRWVFDTDSSPQYSAYRGQGNHNLSVGDVDSDGRDEILYGACAIDDNGKGLYSTGFGHGDAMHLSDIDPDRPGLEVFSIHERPRHTNGVSFYEAATGKIIWGKRSSDVGRGLAADIDPRYRGYEMWAFGEGLYGVWNTKGETISNRRPRSCNFAVWWDGDLLRELLSGNYISKWNWTNSTETTLLVAVGCSANNSTKATPVLSADILGDWREEVIWRTTDNKELRIYTTTIPTKHRLRALMHDPQYRISVACQNVGYNQPPQPGFYLGEGMNPPEKPNITTNKIGK